jgi:23S rRNA (adenine2503-C2)-methyltransferase
MKQILADFNFEEIENLIIELNEPKFRANQIYQGIMNGKKITEINIPLSLKQKLLETFEDSPLDIIENIESQDGTIKFLFKLADGNIIEGVLMSYVYGNTQCVSTQVGCRMNCAFCASGLNGLIRNLSSGEILYQVLAINKFAGGTVKDRKVTNIVLMGSGEPLDNYDNVVKFLKNVNFEKGINISTRNISLSTCGIANKIYDLAEEGFSLNLTISLHSAFDEERKKIMPIANAFSIEQILKACDYYFLKTKRRYIFEYSLIKGQNDSEKDIQALVKLLKGRPCHINLIRLNEVKEKNMTGTDKKEAYRFLGELEKCGLSVSLRRQIGSDIEGACGQLRSKYI